MNAIDLLESQHREVEQLFSRIAIARTRAIKEQLFVELADALVIHATIEEHHFYPAVRARRTDDIPLESLEEHVAIKRVVADLLETAVGDPAFDARLDVLRELVSHHLEEEEVELFPRAAKLLSPPELEAIAELMRNQQLDLEDGGSPRRRVTAGQRDSPASLH